MIAVVTVTSPLSVPQTQVLLAALTRPAAGVWPLPETLGIKGAALRRVLLALLKMALVIEAAAKDGEHVWRSDETGQALTLRATPAARAALGLPEPSAIEPPSPHGAGPRGKLGQVLEALASEGGVTMEALVAMTGWLPHTTRAALTRLRQRGNSIVRERVGPCSTYRIEAPSAARSVEHARNGA